MSGSYLKTIRVISAGFQMYFSRKHPFAEREDLTIDDFRDEAICAPIKNEESVVREYANRVFSVCGFVPREIICKPNLDSVLAEIQPCRWIGA